MNWDDFDAFCQVVEHGGFTAAARALDRPKSSLSASVTRLEEQLGTRLLERTTRSLRLTEAGESLYRDISKPFSQLRELAVDAVAKGAQVQGTLRIAAPYEFGAHHLAAVACRIMAEHPQLKVQHRRGACARAAVRAPLRHRVLVDRAHASRPRASSRAGCSRWSAALFAAPQLLARHPALTGPEDLHALPLLAGADDADWEFTAAGRQPCPRWKCATRACAAATRACAWRRRWQGWASRESRRRSARRRWRRAGWCRLLPEWRCAPLRIYALLPGRRLMPAKVRAFMDALEALPTHQG